MILEVKFNNNINLPNKVVMDKCNINNKDTKKWTIRKHSRMVSLITADRIKWFTTYISPRERWIKKLIMEWETIEWYEI